MNKVIKKWELILRLDWDTDSTHTNPEITYGRDVLIEMLNDFKQFK